MYLKKLDLIGFKSFSDPTTLTLQSGISVVVGPNGCGKSNIVDAILWVLGEQSTKALRSDRMEDVIFNGSESRKPISMAEVTLTVGGVSAQEVLNRWGEFQELSLCRRLFRSGESEYLINRIPCRLKDIRDVLIDTGAGHKGHTIIEQGKVEQLLSSSANDRRGLIEDTAGIGRYKIRKAEAERKLDATHQNLLRVRDIISEVKRQIQGLDRQVRKTETYNTLQGEAQQLEQKLLSDEYRSNHIEWKFVTEQAGEMQGSESALLAQVSSLEVTIQSSKSALIEKEQALTGSRQKTYDVQTHIHRQESRIELLLSQITGWEDQRAHFIREVERLTESQARAEAELEQISKGQEEVKQSLGLLEEKLESRNRSSRDLEARKAEGETAMDQDNTRLFELIGLITEAKNQSAAMESRQQEILRVQEKSRAELAGVTAQIHQRQQVQEEEKAVLAGYEKQADEVQNSQTQLADTLRQAREGLNEMDQKIGLSREEVTRLEGRLASAKEHESGLLASQLSFREHLKEETELLQRFAGIVADAFSVSTEYEKAIEAVLGDRLQALIAEDHSAIHQVIKKLKTAGASRGIFIPKSLRTKPGSLNLTAREGVIGPAIACVQAKAGLETLVQSLLGGVVLVQDLDTALSVWKEGPLSEILVTLEGEVVFPSGMVSGGQPAEKGKGFLRTRRRRAEMESELGHLTGALKALETEQTAKVEQVETLTGQEDELIQTLHRGEIARTAQREKISAVSGELDRLLEKQSLLSFEDLQRTNEIQGLVNTMEEVLSEVQSLEVQHHQIQEKMARGQEELRRWDDQRETLSAELTQLKVDQTSQNERKDVLQREEHRVRNEQNQSGERHRQRQSEADGLVVRIQTAKRDSEETQGEIAKLSQVLTEAQSSLAEKNEEYTEHLNRLKTLEEEQRHVRVEASRLEHRLKDLQIREAGLKIKLENVVERLSTFHSIAPEEIMAEISEEEFDRETSSSRLTELRVKMEQMGPVNMAAPEEYKELEERFKFLNDQESDLTRSVEDLQRAIQKINRTAKELFLTAYRSLREKFQEVFVEFFQGGEADLILEDEANPLESAIEIMAQPPGKRLRHISLLSGGEKALTAISLLFASFLIHSTPFCILDEIDAPLDEENTRRFLRALRRMTDHSQFIIITHNKRTMEQGDILYGVTMEEPGVSKLVSVKLESRGNGNGGATPEAKAVVSPAATA